jgi:hypothetical protein
VLVIGLFLFTNLMELESKVSFGYKPFVYHCKHMASQYYTAV